MRITRETDYAIIVLTELAERDKKLSASALAEKCALNLSLVSKVLKLLVKAELLRSTRGVYGGYELIKSPEEVTLLDVIVAIEGPVAVNACNDEDNPCDKAADCTLAPHWRVINQKIYRSFAEVTLQSLLEAPGKLKHQFNLNTP